MSGSRLRELREAAELTQAELALRAGVSRQLVGAVEAGRNLPRVDAALALAGALGVDVRSIFSEESMPADVVSGETPADGSLVRAAAVGNRIVTAPARLGPEGWGEADGTIEGLRFEAFRPLSPGLVVAGCEPGLQLLEETLRHTGMGAVAAAGSSATSIAALRDGRVHAAVVHGRVGEVRSLPDDVGVDRFHLVRWRVGLAAAPDAKPDWRNEALSGKVSVVQREAGAGVQKAFEDAVGRGGIAGPTVGSHLEAAERAMLTGMPAVTMEPAALALGAAFHALEVHEAQLWVAAEWLGDRVVCEAMNVIAGAGFQRRLSGVGGYDLGGCGTRVA